MDLVLSDDRARSVGKLLDVLDEGVWLTGADGAFRIWSHDVPLGKKIRVSVETARTRGWGMTEYAVMRNTRADKRGLWRQVTRIELGVHDRKGHPRA